MRNFIIDLKMEVKYMEKISLIVVRFWSIVTSYVAGVEHARRHPFNLHT